MSTIGLLSRLGYIAIQRQNVLFNNCPKFKFFSNKPLEPTIVEGVPASAVAQRKTKRPVVPKITLISGKDDISVTTLEDAQKLATRRSLKLVKIVDLDAKTERPVYKLMTAAQYAAEDVNAKKDRKSNSPYKGEKVLMISSVISDHDLQTQVRKIEKWIAKEYEVRVSLSGNLEKSEEVYKKLEEQLVDKVRFLQKRAKGMDIRFQVVPPKRDKSSEASGGNQNKSGL